MVCHWTPVVPTSMACLHHAPLKEVLSPGLSPQPSEAPGLGPLYVKAPKIGLFNKSEMTVEKNEGPCQETNTPEPEICFAKPCQEHTTRKSKVLSKHDFCKNKR